jgi:hypothetical protein
MEEQILINVNADGTVEVYWHDPEGSGALQPKVSVLYDSDRTSLHCVGGLELEKYIADFDEVLEDDNTYQIE